MHASTEPRILVTLFTFSWCEATAVIVLPVHSLCSLSSNGSTVPSKVSSSESVIQCLLFQIHLCHWQLHIYFIIYCVVNLYINFRKAQIARDSEVPLNSVPAPHFLLPPASLPVLYSPTLLSFSAV